MKVTALLLGAALLLVPLPAMAQQDATAAVQAHVDAVLKVLGNPALKGPKGDKQKRAEVVTEADRFFDFVELRKADPGPFLEQVQYGPTQGVREPL